MLYWRLENTLVQEIYGGEYHGAYARHTCNGSASYTPKLGATPYSQVELGIRMYCSMNVLFPNLGSRLYAKLGKYLAFSLNMQTHICSGGAYVGHPQRKYCTMLKWKTNPCYHGYPITRASRANNAPSYMKNSSWSSHIPICVPVTPIRIIWLPNHFLTDYPHPV